MSIFEVGYIHWNEKNISDIALNCTHCKNICTIFVHFDFTELPVLGNKQFHSV
jgi:hypothetical protein